MDKWRPTECVIPAPELLDSIASGLSAERVADLEIDCADIVEQSLLSVMRNPESDFYDGSQEWRPYYCVLNPEETVTGDEMTDVYNECVAVDVADRAILFAMR